MNIRSSDKFFPLSLFTAIAMLGTAGCEKQKVESAAPVTAPTAPEPKPASVPAVPDLTMPNAILGKWKKQGGTGWHVFETPTHHYWNDGKERNNHRISLKEKNGAWYIYWWDIERPAEKVEITQKDGKVIMRTIPTTRGGLFLALGGGGFKEETFVKE